MRGCCGGVSPGQVGQDFSIPKDYLGATGFSSSIQNKQEHKLVSYYWPAHTPRPKAVIILSHDDATYVCFDFLRYQAAGLPHVYENSWVQHLNHCGYAVCAIDQQGCGRSQGLRAYVDKLQDHVDDLLLFARHISATGGAAFPDMAPRFLLGYGMGGLVALMAVLQQPQNFSGVVLLSPLLSLTSKELARGAVGLRSALMPKSCVGPASDACPVPWIAAARMADPYVFNGGMRARTAAQCMSAYEQLPGQLQGLQHPLLAWQADDDTWVDPSGSSKLLEQAASPDKDLRTCPKRWHALVKEEGNDTLLMQLTEWLDVRHSRQPPAAVGAPAADADVGSAPPPAGDPIPASPAPGGDMLPGSFGGNAGPRPYVTAPNDSANWRHREQQQSPPGEPRAPTESLLGNLPPLPMSPLGRPGAEDSPGARTSSLPPLGPAHRAHLLGPLPPLFPGAAPPNRAHSASAEPAAGDGASFASGARSPLGGVGMDPGLHRASSEQEPGSYTSPQPRPHSALAPLDPLTAGGRNSLLLGGPSVSDSPQMVIPGKLPPIGRPMR